MKALLYLFLMMLVYGCKKSEVSFNANNLNGTWKLSSSSSLSNTRWTFEPKYLYIASDSSNTCRPADGQPWQYQVIGKTIHARYVGISNGLIPIQDIRCQIAALSDSILTLERSGLDVSQFIKCR